MRYVLPRQVNSLAKLRGYFFAELAVRVCIGRSPHTGVPEIVARPMHTHPDCEQLNALSKKHPLANQINGYPQENASLRIAMLEP